MVRVRGHVAHLREHDAALREQLLVANGALVVLLARQPQLRDQLLERRIRPLHLLQL